MEVDALCPHCKCRQTLAYQVGSECTSCEKPLFEFSTDALKESAKLSQCPLCGGAHLYRQRDFNRKLGIALLIAGIAGAYFTYGISLVAVTLLDIFLFRRVGEIAICYQCQAVFRNFRQLASIEPFNLSLYDYYRNLRRPADA